MHSLDTFLLLVAPPAVPASRTEAMVLALIRDRGAAVLRSVDTPDGGNAAPAGLGVARTGTSA